MAESAPQFLSVPNVFAVLGEAYAYDDDRTAEVSGGGALRFEKRAGPDGLAIDALDGSLSWTPVAEGVFPVTLAAVNQLGTATQAFVVIVAEEVEMPVDPPVIVSTPAVRSTVGLPYAYDADGAAEATGEEAAMWSLVSGPVGFEIDAVTGVVTWTPAETGFFEVTLAADNGGGRVTQTFGVLVADPPPEVAPAITSAPNTLTPLDLPYRYDADGQPTALGDGPLRWSLGASPVGMGVDSASGAITWTPIAAGLYQVVLIAANDLGTDAQAFEIEVPDPVLPRITSAPAGSVTAGTPYAYDADGHAEADSPLPVTWRLGDAPAGFGVDAGSGRVTWVPTQAGRFDVELIAASDNGEDLQAFEVIVDPAPDAPTIYTVANVEATAGAPYAYSAGGGERLMALGTPPLAWTLVDGPAGMALDPVTGELSWSPAATGRYPVEVAVDNAAGQATQLWEINVTDPSVAVASMTPAAAYRGFSTTVTLRGRGFAQLATPTVRLAGQGQSPLSLENVVRIDDRTLTATVPVHALPPAVYDVEVLDGEAVYALPKRFTVVTAGGVNHSGVVFGDQTWRAIDNPHLLTADFDLVGTLTLEPGVVVMVNPGHIDLDVGVDQGIGALIADGGVPGEGDPIVITSNVAPAVPTRGDFRGLRFGALHDAAKTRLRNVIVEFGGYSQGVGAVYVTAGADPDMQDCTVRESGDYGVVFTDGSGGTRGFDRNVLTRNARQPIRIYANHASTLGDDLTLAGNDIDHLLLVSDVINRADARLVARDVPYGTTGSVQVQGTTLRLMAGAQVLFADNAELVVAVGGVPAALVADSDGAPIRLGSLSGTPGSWQGVQLLSLTAPGSILRGVIVEDFGSGNDGGIEVDDGASPPTIQGCILRNGIRPGVFINNRVSLPVFTGNVMQGVPYSLRVSFASLSQMLGSSNVYDAPLWVAPGTWTGETAAWDAPQDSAGNVVPIDVIGGDAVLRGGTLTLGAGMWMRFDDNDTLRVDASGGGRARLLANGVPGAPVLFTAIDAGEPWRGLRFDGLAPEGPSELHWTVVEYAGGSTPADVNSRGNVEVYGGAQLVVQDSILRRGNANGIVFADGSHADGQFSRNVVEDNRYCAASIYGDYLGRLGVDNSYSGNGLEGCFDGIRVRTDSIFSDALWPNDGAAYFLTGGEPGAGGGMTIRGGALLEIEAGTELYFAEGGSLSVGTGDNPGDLVAVGTEADPIVFDSVLGMPGDWHGVIVRESVDSGDTALAHVSVRHAGRNGGQADAAIDVRAGAVAQLSDCEVLDGAANGIHFRDGATVDVARLTVAGHARAPIVIRGNQVGDLPDSLTVGANNLGGLEQEDGIRVISDNITEDATWLDHGVPYVATGGQPYERGYVGVRGGATLTLMAGVEVAFAGGGDDDLSSLDGRLEVGAGGELGELVAGGGLGTDPVVIYRAPGNPIGWRGLVFQAGSSNLSSLDNVELRGGGNQGTSHGTLRLANGSAPLLQDVVLADGDHFAARWDNGANPTFIGLSYADNGPGCSLPDGAFGCDCIYQLASGTCVRP